MDQSDAAHAACIGMQLGRTLNEAIEVALALDARFDVSSQLQSFISVGYRPRDIAADISDGPVSKWDRTAEERKRVAATGRIHAFARTVIAFTVLVIAASFLPQV
jgi:hypothetical protein